MIYCAVVVVVFALPLVDVGFGMHLWNTYIYQQPLLIFVLWLAFNNKSENPTILLTFYIFSSQRSKCTIAYRLQQTGPEV